MTTTNYFKTALLLGALTGLILLCGGLLGGRTGVVLALGLRSFRLVHPHLPRPTDAQESRVRKAMSWQ